MICRCIYNWENLKFSFLYLQYSVTFHYRQPCIYPWFHCQVTTEDASLWDRELYRENGCTQLPSANGDGYELSLSSLLLLVYIFLSLCLDLGSLSLSLSLSFSFFLFTVTQSIKVNRKCILTSQLRKSFPSCNCYEIAKPNLCFSSCSGFGVQLLCRKFKRSTLKMQSQLHWIKTVYILLIQNTMKAWVMRSFLLASFPSSSTLLHFDWEKQTRGKKLCTKIRPALLSFLLVIILREKGERDTIHTKLWLWKWLVLFLSRILCRMWQQGRDLCFSSVFFLPF